jgi:hypothetical protein
MFSGIFGGLLAIGLYKLVPRWAAAVHAAVPGAIAKLQAIPEWLESKTIARWGYHLPAEMHQAIDNALTKSVQWAESIFGNEDFIKAVCYIIKGKPALIGERLMNLLVEWVRKGSIWDLVPPELREVFNEAQENEALKVAKANIAAALPAEVRPTDEQIRADIRAIAPAAGRTIPVSPIDPHNPPILQRPKECQDLIEQLRLKNAPAAQ